MARPLRLEFPGALYHVISRGNERAPIFRDDNDRSDFLDLLASVVLKETLQLHAYCLLGNHYHLLLETPAGQLSRGMHHLNARYAQRFNQRHERCGHLFEGRFKAIIVERQLHLLELHRYIVLNPVRAGLVERPEAWKWSSYRATAGRVHAPPWLQTHWTLSQFGRGAAEGRRAFVEFVEGAIERAPATGPVRNQIFMGGDDFLTRMQHLLGERVWDPEIAIAQQTPNAPELGDIQRAVSQAWGLPVSALQQRRAGHPKLAAIYLARKLTHLPVREIAEAFGVGRGRVGNVVAEVDGGKHPELQRRLPALIAEIGRRKTVKKTGQKCQVET